MKLDRKLRPSIALAPDGPTLALGRAHEATGPSAVVFAALTAGRLAGPVLWIRQAWDRSFLNPEGLAPFFDPARLVIARAPRPLDALWTAEEALRSGAAPTVIVETAEPPALTPLRRLQLAAEAGGEIAGDGKRSAAAPICLILPPRAGTAGAVESRWRCTPTPSDARLGRHVVGWRFERTYSKAGPPLTWEWSAPFAAFASAA